MVVYIRRQFLALARAGFNLGTDEPNSFFVETLQYHIEDARCLVCMIFFGNMDFLPRIDLPQNRSLCPRPMGEGDAQRSGGFVKVLP